MANNIFKENPSAIREMNISIITNFSKLKVSLFLIPLFFILAITLFVYSQGAFSIDNYVQIQKSTFLFINAELSQFPNIIYNLTQLGDAMILLSLLTIFIIYAPKLWEALLSASLVSALFSNVLKKIFAVPRPAALFDNSSFTIIGKTLTGQNSLPSGHSITVFTILTVLLYAFMPKKWSAKLAWTLGIIAIGLLLVLTRVGVGAHYPLDVISGSIIGYISGLSGIFISNKYKLWYWINFKKYYPIFILLFVICCCVLISKINKENLIIFYLSLISFVVSLYKIITVYVKK
ncbi:MAG: phosphatase PAP2 family protein [Flavobacterium sp.]|nr:phosphatase PAP2 family protein [Flavobacterium sp.]